MKKLMSACAILVFSTAIHAQKVGIGTATPSMALHVAAADSAVILLENLQPSGTNVSTGLYYKNGNFTYPYTGAIKTIGASATAARLGFFTYASPTPAGLLERVSIMDDGSVGIGTTAPQTFLHVNPNSGGSLLIGKDRSSGGYTDLEMGISALSNGYGYIQATKAAGTTYGNLGLNINGGRVGIGTASPLATLDVRGGVALPINIVTADYTALDNDYTIVVDMQNDSNKVVNIYLPGHIVNTGRVIKVAAINMQVKYYGTAYPISSTKGIVHVFNSSGTVEYGFLYQSFREYTESNNTSTVYSMYQKKTNQQCITAQCMGAAGWVVTDMVSDNFNGVILVY